MKLDDHRPRRVGSPVGYGALALLGALCLTASAVTATTLVAAPANAAPGTPGSPQPGTAVFAEDFENGVGQTPLDLTAYAGRSGQRYTADGVWQVDCNGQIRSFDMPTAAVGNCANQTAVSYLNQLAYALGVQSGAATPSANHAVTAYTDTRDPGANTTELQTASNIPLASGSGRFLTFSIDAAAVNCQNSGPRYLFSFLDENGSATRIGNVVDACTSTKIVTAPAVGVLAPTAVRVGTYTLNEAVLFRGASLGLRIQNANGAYMGNDAAFDNVRVLDVSPQVDKSFSPTSVAPGQASTLTFTVANTAELAAKRGWSFTDRLPAGLTVASPAGTSTTCGGAVTAATGSDTITVQGDLGDGAPSCTVSVAVTATSAGTYTNGPGNMTLTGLNPPADATLTVTAPGIGLVKHAGTPVDVDGDGLADAGDTVSYTFTVTNTGNTPLTGIVVDDPKAGTVTCPATVLNPGERQTCATAAPYTITAADERAGRVENTATASGSGPGGAVVVSPPSTTRTPVDSPRPSLGLVKTADRDAVDEIGQKVVYSFMVTNTGNMPLTSLAIAEDAFNGNGADPVPTCPATALAPGETITCTATYTTVPADAAVGMLTNTATAAAVSAHGTIASEPSVAETALRIPPAPSPTPTPTATPTSKPVAIPALAVTGADAVPLIAAAGLAVVFLTLGTLTLLRHRRNR
ncbi:MULTISPECIES: DUF7507 domain-containing protein [Bacteria]|uniref:DUF7507 domain-containing protein n=1 Tax=Bacteria TaxID=2 RepID=UPI003C7E0732